MDSFIESLNQWGGNFLNFAWPMLWQSSLLIAAVFGFDFLFRRKLRASIRYALWLVVLVKLCVPPTLALPTSPAWWLHPTSPPAVVKPAVPYTITYDHSPPPAVLQTSLPAFVPPKPAMNFTAWLLAFSASVSLALFLWLLARWWQIARQIRRAKPSERLAALGEEAQKFIGMKCNLRVKLTNNSMSPAVCGLLRPAILVPQSLAEHFSDEQMRAVLLHELIHLRRGDVWVSFLQALLQIFYWWHPLVWLANARIRRVREEAVDDAVMLALRDEAEAYAPTLLEVAKLALNRPRVSLGLVGIMESRHALRQRIERLVDFRAPRHAGLTLLSLLGLLAFTAVAVPMGEKPVPAQAITATALPASEDQSLTVKVDPAMFIRNLKAQAKKYLLAPTNDYTDILLVALRSEGVECNPPHGLAFNTQTGEITTQNTPDELAVFRQVVEQLNRADGICELPLHNPAIRRKLVLIQAAIYELNAADFDKITPGLGFYPGRHGDDAWWSVAPDKFNQLTGSLESSGLHPVQRPRIQTSSGRPAQFFVGSETNGVVLDGIEFDCLPFVKDGFVDLTLQSTVVTGQPARGAFTNQFNTKASAEDHGGIVVRMENFDGHADSNVVVVIGVQIVTNGAPSQFQQRLQTIIKRSSDTNEDASSLFNRTFKVDARTFLANLRQLGADLGETTNSPAAVSAAARKFFTGLGVNMESPPGKAVFFNDRSGYLLVRATETDLDTIERALPVLNQMPPQIHIKARFFEVPKGTLAGLGKLLNLTNPAVADQFTGILNDTNARTVLRSLESRRGVEILAEPEVTTISGRQTQMRATQIITIITNMAFVESLTNGPGSVTPQTEQMETGPILDVIPYVLADGYTINLTVIPSLREFLGYDKAPDEHFSRYDTRVQLPAVLPKFSVRQVTATLNLWDNQTVVVGGLSQKNYGYVNGKVSAEKPGANEKELLVLITATIVDAAGNRVHADGEMPFSKAGIPPQPQGVIRGATSRVGDFPPYHNGGRGPWSDGHDGPGATP